MRGKLLRDGQRLLLGFQQGRLGMRGVDMVQLRVHEQAPISFGATMQHSKRGFEERHFVFGNATASSFLSL